MPKSRRSQLEKPVLSQEEFLSSTFIRTDYLWPFSQKSYWRFKLDPRWPEPALSGGGREIYRRADIDRFLRRLGDEGMTPEVANAIDDDKPVDAPAMREGAAADQGHNGGPPLDDTKSTKTRRRPKTKPKARTVKKRSAGRLAAAAD